MVTLRFVIEHDDHDEIVTLVCPDELFAWKMRESLFKCSNVVAVYVPKII